jgi:hypothetical protein
VRSYLLHLRDERGVARGTYAILWTAGLLLARAEELVTRATLQRPAAMACRYSQKRVRRPSTDDYPTFSPTSRRAQSLAA